MQDRFNADLIKDKVLECINRFEQQNKNEEQNNYIFSCYPSIWHIRIHTFGISMINNTECLTLKNEFMSRVFRVTPKRVKRTNGTVLTPEMEVTVTRF